MRGAATSALEWIIEAFLRVFARVVCAGGSGSKVNRQTHIGVDKSRGPAPTSQSQCQQAMSATLTGPGGALSNVAADAVKSYLRYARAQGWVWTPYLKCQSSPRNGFDARASKPGPISGHEFTDLRQEMAAWDEARKDDQNATSPDPCPATRADHQTERSRTGRLAVDDVTTLTAGPSDVATEALDSAHALTIPAESVRIVLADTQGKQHPIISKSVLIGRSRECAVRFESAEVSREHVNVYFQEGKWWLRDRGSRNGTTVDGQRGQGRLVPCSQVGQSDRSRR